MMETKTKMQMTIDEGVEFWNDSCVVKELTEAVSAGAVGATSNPVIVENAVRSEPDRWLPLLDGLLREYPKTTEDEIAGKFIEKIGQRAASLLEPIYRKTEGQQGFLCLQINPKFYPSVEKMVEHGKNLARVAPNIAVKCPATMEGIEVIEELTANGININATVSFSISQVLSVAEAIERGIDKAHRLSVDTRKLHPYVTIMVGRIDDQMKRSVVKENVTMDPGYLNWAGIAVFKKAYALFKKRGYQSKLLAAAYRHHLQWSELIGENLILSIPYKWWRQFNDSDIPIEKTIEKPVDERIVKTLYEKIDDFRKIYDEDGMPPEDFIKYGASVCTLNQFLQGYHKVVETVRERRFALLV